MGKQFYIIILLCKVSACVWAQTFEVRQFKALQNDITAYIEPVKDLNEEACALVKVVGEPAFVFSSPLGIVLRTEQVGEIWIYLPKGSRKITIKHPRWGVLRDYTFPEKLESRLTYELVLQPPIERDVLTLSHMRMRSSPRSLMLHSSSLPPVLPVRGRGKPKRPKVPVSYLAQLNLALYDADIAYGAMVGCVGWHGGYIRVLSNFRSFRTVHEADKTGLWNDGETTPYYTGRTFHSRHSFTAGGIHRLSGFLYMYEGLGYGTRTLAWETTENERVKISDYSNRGLTLEAGILLKRKHWVSSLGALSIKGAYWELVCGVGMNF